MIGYTSFCPVLKIKFGKAIAEKLYSLFIDAITT